MSITNSIVAAGRQGNHLCQCKRLASRFRLRMAETDTRLGERRLAVPVERQQVGDSRREFPKEVWCCES